MDRILTLEEVRGVIEPGLRDIKSGVDENIGQMRRLEAELKTEREARIQVEKAFDDHRKKAELHMRGGFSQPTLQRGEFVSDGCARLLAAKYVISGLAQEKFNGNPHADNLWREASSVLKRYGVEVRTALTTSDIPLPVEYGKEVVELIWKYGQARQYATHYPLGTGTAKLPKLKTSPAFGFYDMSAPITEKSPQIEFVDFAAKKAGGIIRLPSEIEADSFVSTGQFIARYCAREFAKWEDTTLFTADGTATYKLISGVGKKADTLGKKHELDAGETSPSNITLEDLRALRSHVATAALSKACYYMNLTHEPLLTGFNNNSTNGMVFSWTNGEARLDGFPVRWVDVMPVYDTGAHASQYQVYFGDMSYWFFAERGTPLIETSRDVYFATDEIGIRALERFDCGLMADDAMAVLKLPAA